MHDDTARPPVHAARPTGTGFEHVDTPLVRQMQELLAAGRASSSTDAARQVAHKARGASPEAIIDRLVRLHSRLFPVIPGSQARGESDSLAPMTPTGQPDLAARVAALEARCAEQDGMMAELIDRVRESIEAQAKGNELAERQTDALERHAAATERRLDDLDVERLN